MHRLCGARQRGAALIIALIVLVLISLAVVSAFNLSSSNLKSVANVQYRSEAVAGANRAIEEVVSGSFLAALGTTINKDIDIDKNGSFEYQAKVAIPSCPVRVRRVALEAPSGYELSDGTSTLAGVYVADYQLTSTVSDTSLTGASVSVVQGVRVPMQQSDYDTYVAPCGLTLITGGND